MSLSPACNSSGLKSANAAISAQGGCLHSITLIPAAADCNVIIYDNASAASGTVLAKLTGLANTASVTLTFNNPVYANLGLYAAIAGVGANYIVHYSL